MSSPAASIIQSMESVPVAWASAWSKAPSTVHYKGATYSKLSADTPEKRAWYLAAASLEDASAVARMAPYQVDANGEGAYCLDADPSELNAARSDYAQKQAVVTAAQQKIKTYEGEQRKWEKDLKGKWAIDIPGQIYANAKISWYKDQIEQQRLALANAQSDVTAARAALQSAQQTYDDQTRQIRQQEEAARQQALQAQQAAQQQAAQDAAARQAAAEAASAAYWSMPSNAGVNYYPGSDALLGSAQGEVWDPFAGLQGMNDEWVEDGTPFGVDAETADAVDFHGQGDPEEALAYLAQHGEDRKGLTRHLSAYSFDRYYGAASTDYVDRMFGPVRGGLMLGADDKTASDGAGGSSQVFATVARILGQIVEAAPEILKSTKGPGPSETRASPGTPIAQTLADATGLTQILDEKAAKAGQEAGEKAKQGVQNAGLFILAGLALLAVVLSSKKAPAAGGA